MFNHRCQLHHSWSTEAEIPDSHVDTCALNIRGKEQLYNADSYINYSMTLNRVAFKGLRLLQGKRGINLSTTLLRK